MNFSDPYYLQLFSRDSPSPPPSLEALGPDLEGLTFSLPAAGARVQLSYVEFLSYS